MLLSAAAAESAQLRFLAYSHRHRPMAISEKVLA